VFIAYGLTITTGEEVSVEHLSAMFKKWLTSSGADAGDVILELKRCAMTYQAMLTLDVEDPTRRLLDGMAATQTNTPWPLVLYLRATIDTPMSSAASRPACSTPS
jgi:hypothetical protein